MHRIKKAAKIAALIALPAGGAILVYFAAKKFLSRPSGYRIGKFGPFFVSEEKKPIGIVA